MAGEHPFHRASISTDSKMRSLDDSHPPRAPASSCAAVRIGFHIDDGLESSALRTAASTKSGSDPSIPDKTTGALAPERLFGQPNTLGIDSIS
jgi:hypothetical protein